MSKMQVPTEHLLLVPRSDTNIHGIGLLRSVAGSGCVIVGVGQVLRGDDGVGPLVCSRITGRVGATVIDAGPVPENFLGPILRSGADNLVIVDAVELHQRPGAVAILALDDVRSAAISTHCAGLELVARFIRMSGRVLLVGIQPLSWAFGQGLSEPVMAAADRVARFLIETFPIDSVPKKTPGSFGEPWRC